MYLRRYIQRGFAVLAILTICHSAQAQQNLWGDFRYGMTKAEATAVSATPLVDEKENSADGCARQSGFAPINLGGIEFQVGLSYCKVGLDRIVLKAIGLSDRADVEAAQKNLELALQHKYGSPSAHDELVHEERGFYSQSWRWLNAGTDIQLIALTVADRWGDSTLAVVYSCETACLAGGL